jgi:hypothetical protein
MPTHTQFRLHLGCPHTPGSLFWQKYVGQPGNRKKLELGRPVKKEATTFIQANFYFYL